MSDQFKFLTAIIVMLIEAIGLLFSNTIYGSPIFSTIWLIADILMLAVMIAMLMIEMRSRKKSVNLTIHVVLDSVVILSLLMIGYSTLTVIF